MGSIGDSIRGLRFKRELRPLSDMYDSRALDGSGL